MTLTVPKQYIFLCDDDSDIIDVTRIILETRFEVIVFRNCEDIVQAAERIQPKLILLDLWMPETGGENIAIELKSNSKTRKIPLYLFSAVNNLPAIARKVSADGYLSKPYDLKQLEALLNKIAL